MRKVKRLRGNYQKMIFEKIATGEIPAIPGKVTLIDVRHDNWCQFWKGKRCNCQPEIITSRV